MIETKKTTCVRDCPDACRITADVEDGRVVRIGGDPDHPVTRGFLCFRTGRFLERQYAADRITTPLLKRGDAHVPISWDDALDLAASTLVRIKDESGPAAIFHYRSGGSLGFLLSTTDLFFSAFGPVTTKRGDICSGAGDAAQTKDFGVEDSHDLLDLLHSRHVLLWGKNVFVSSPHTIPVLKEAKQRGARITYVDPVRTKTTTIADRYVQVRPGADFALAMAVAAVCFARGFVDPRAPSYCDGFDGFRALATSRGVDAWCAEADLHVEEAEAIAAALGDGPTAILVGWGMGRRGNGSGVVRALDALAAITGNLGVPGGGVSFYFNRKTAYDVSWAQRAPPPRTVVEPLFGEQILAARDPPIRAVWITAGNPVAMLPDAAKNAAALASRDFVVVTDWWMSDTAKLAHLVLPIPTLLETDDVVGAYGHHWLGAATPVVPPPPQVKSDLEIMQGLAARTGLADVMAGSARAWKRRVVEPKLAAHGVDVDALERGPVRNPLAPTQVLFADRVFPTPTGRAQLVQEAPPPPPVVDDEWPMTLLSCSTDRSQSSVYARPPTGPAEVTVHPDAARGVADGATARLESAVGAIDVVVRHDPTQRRDVALMAKGGGFFAGRSANALIRGKLTDDGEGGALYDERVRLVPSDASTARTS